MTPLPGDAEVTKEAGCPSVVVIGGGTGLSVLLRGLKHLVAGPDCLTAIVTVADDGGSSGRLRRELGVLPPGDIRNCIVALADDEDLLARLFQYRFPNGKGLSGHSFGNLFLTALTGVTGDFYQAILTAEQILSVRGRILPATLQDVRLRGAGLSGRVYEGESAVGRSGEKMASLRLEPANAPAFPPAIDALERSDLVVLGPGSLYTSLVPNLLIPGIRGAIRRCRAKVVLVLNLMTQPGETDGLDAIGHVRALEEHLGEQLVDLVLVNRSRPPERLLERYRDSDAHWLEADPTALEDLGVETVEADLLLAGDDFIRHDPARLARA
ncbi:MAG: uridine diphosphate-N-acetylglucosamine-binding protein YvcK, partial [Holophagales bacterium]|nr:uridine diphosphate-N-acetylglucosamine-binding protein YvcK [Holophagales bacterium]